MKFGLLLFCFRERNESDSSMSDPAPLCLDGARSCPQEDVGGVWGHQL